MPPVKIYVGNIHSSARSAELKELFEKFGKVVECDILKDFGFVHMDDTNDAKAAIAGLNDTLWKGARIRVEISTTKTSKGEPSLRHKSDRRSDSGGPHRRPSSTSYRHNPISHHRSSGRGPLPPPPPPPMMHRDGYLPSSPSRSRNGGGPIRDSRYSSSSNGSSSRYDRGGRGAPMPPPPPYPDRGYDRGGPLLPPPPMPPNGSRNGDSYGRERNGYPHHHPYMRPGGHPPPPPPPPHHDDYYRGSNGSGMGIPPGMPPPPPPSSSRYEFDQYGPPSSRARYANSYK